MGDEPTLYEGDLGVNGWVTALQQALLDVGYDPGGVDGKFKWRTAKAVVAFQRAQGLKVDGKVGNQTWAALRGRTPESPGANNPPFGATYAEPEQVVAEPPDTTPRKPAVQAQRTGDGGNTVSAGSNVLERVGAAWHLTVQGFTEPEVLGAVLWNGGPPPQVRIAAVVVVTEPAQIGTFEIAGLDGAAFDAMDPHYAKWFWDLGWRHPQPEPAQEGHPLHTVRLWFKAFIPQAELYGPPGYDCFLGDNRGFSNDRAAPARMHSEIVLEGLHTPTPTMSEHHWCGLTSQVDCSTGQLVASGHAPTDGMRFYNLRYPGAEVYDTSDPYPPPANPGTIIVPGSAPLSVDYIGAAADPLVPGAPLVDLWAHIELDLQSGVLTVTGAVDDYPAFEAYVLVNEQHGPFGLVALDGDDAVLSLVGGANRSFDESLSIGSYAAMG